MKFLYFSAVLLCVATVGASAEPETPGDGGQFLADRTPETLIDQFGISVSPKTIVSKNTEGTEAVGNEEAPVGGQPDWDPPVDNCRFC